MRRTLLALVSLGMVGCADTTRNPLAPDPLTNPLSAAELDGVTANTSADPVFSTSIENSKVELNLHDTFGEKRGTLEGYAFFTGSHWSMTPSLTIEYKYNDGSVRPGKPGTLPVAQGIIERKGLFSEWPPFGPRGITWQFILESNKCVTAQATMVFRVWMINLIGQEYLVQQLPGSTVSHVQGLCDPPPCPTRNGSEASLAAYDPYSPADDSASPECGESDGNGDTKGDPSGIQFKPGDSTGGETVTWSTGVGNGGNSECGDAAVVDYVCFQFEWTTPDGEMKREVHCGYVTTC